MKKEIAIIYDVDGTLAKGNLPEQKLLPDLGINTQAFWQETENLKKQNDSDGILAYMHLLAKKAAAKNFKLSPEIFAKYGSEIKFFKGVDTWFNRINKFSTDQYVIRHYIISSGLHEMLASTSIAKHFKQIFACKYLYDENDSILSPAVAINYTTKTQYLFRINKGILNHYDDKALNKWMATKDRPVPFSRMIYLGDGDTDIPAMKMVKTNGGASIGVFDPDKWSDSAHQDKIYKLISEDRVTYVAPADYSNSSQLDILIKGILGRIINENK
ncbi:MAG: haloacid dehalogenase-like hydrolase [Patescibacteria group bacterium]|jgi:hypothetical protein